MRKMLMLGASALILAGCATGGGYAGPKRGFEGQVKTFWADVNVVSTTYLTDTEAPMQGTVEGNGLMPDQTDMVSTMKSRPDGSFEMTGPGVFWHGMAAFCRVAVNSPLCGANPPPELLAAFPDAGMPATNRVNPFARFVLNTPN